MSERPWGFGRRTYHVEGPCEACGGGDGRSVLQGDPPVWVGPCCFVGRGDR
jgi:hypothetical protein